MASLTNINKGGDIIYLVSDAGDFYLIGQASNETLITSNAISLTNINKN